MPNFKISRYMTPSVALFALLPVTLITPAERSSAQTNVIYSFTATSNGGYPTAGLVQGPDGNLYGTTSNNGVYGVGTVYKMTTAGALTTIYSFSGHPNGAFPYGGVVFGADGSIYGTTADGGASGVGTVFKITPAGTESVIHSFSGTSGDAYPLAGLTIGPDGNLYGAAQGSGSYGWGAVFQLTPSGSYTILHQFNGGADGSYPLGSLTFGTDGCLYGTTLQGGLGYGTVFKITTAGALTHLYSFSGLADGMEPWDGLALGSDGTFYGTAEGGGSGYGTVFKITPTGSLTVIHAFGNADGSSPLAGLIQGRDGNFYGTTYYGGASSDGAVFNVTPAGAFTLLHSFAGGSDGLEPRSTLVMAANGLLYGSTYEGGSASAGTVYSVDPPADPTSGPVSIDCGGLAGGAFVVDSDFVGGSMASTVAAITTGMVSTPVPPQSVLQAARTGVATYTLGGFTPNTAHSVALYFADFASTGSGQRQFNVTINGSPVLTNFDIFASTGGADRAIQENFRVNANANGQVVIALTAGLSGTPIINAISVN